MGAIPVTSRGGSPEDGGGAFAREFARASANRSWLRRASGAVLRRLGRTWSHLRGARPQGFGCEAALDWLLRSRSVEECLTRPGQLEALRAATAAIAAAEELGQFEAARCWQEGMLVGETSSSGGQSRAGEIRETAGLTAPARRNARNRDSCRLALAAMESYRSGDEERCADADRMVRQLASRQADDGRIEPAARRRGGGQGGSTAAAVEATAMFLLAAVAQVRCRLWDADHDFPASIVDGDGRVRAVIEWVERLCVDSGRPKHGPPSIVDLGCGAGRYLRQLRRALPDAKLTGIDACQRALAGLPADVERRQGNLLRLPAETGEFDAAMCVEALEHALAPRYAVAEVCRVVRPGGSVLLLDKQLTSQPLSEHQPWERWFRPEEVALWLAEHCQDVRSSPVAHGGNGAATGLFYCWTARRRAR
ncbi:MAG: methyltransferase domain-containing protein [Planctomycetia bacterium]|nr:methyltransferase domain-containing protein [Planctomycetia bacterium]